MDTTELTPLPAQKARRWPVALLVAFITAIGSAALTIPVADWAMEVLNVSNFEGGRGYSIVFLYVPLALLAGFATGFALSFFVKRGGFAGYAIRQGIALLVTAIIILGIGGLAWATADHPPLIDGKNLALDIEARVPANGRSIEDLKAAKFDFALVASASDRSYSDTRWSEATRTDEFITVPAWAALKSSDAGREITAGIDGESRQIFTVMLRAKPTKLDEWSDWAPPRERFDHSKPAPNEQYLVRYRVRFADEYSPTPAPTPTREEQSPPSEESATPASSPNEQ